MNYIQQPLQDKRNCLASKLKSLPILQDQMRELDTMGMYGLTPKVRKAKKALTNKLSTFHEMIEELKQEIKEMEG